MSKFKSLLTAAFTLPFVAACAQYDLDATKGLATSGNAFQDALHKEYVDLAVMEDDEADLPDAAYFVNRATVAAAGKDGGPQDMSERKIPAAAAGDLRISRNMLKAALSANATTKIPGEAARAQAMYDCWMQEQEENDQPDDIARCRAGFEDAIKKVYAKLDEKAPAPAPAPKATLAEVSFIVFFDFDSADIRSSEKEKITQIANAMKEGRSGIILTGHTDTAGEKAYNQALSEKRVMAIKAALGAQGVAADAIKANGMGEMLLRVTTEDNVREGGNRRVNVLVR